MLLNIDFLFQLSSSAEAQQLEQENERLIEQLSSLNSQVDQVCLTTIAASTATAAKSEEESQLPSRSGWFNN